MVTRTVRLGEADPVEIMAAVALREAVAELLGAETLPEGYNAMMTFSIPWVVDLVMLSDARPDADHVARFRVRGLTRHPERLEELIGEIAMARSLLER